MHFIHIFLNKSKIRNKKKGKKGCNNKILIFYHFAIKYDEFITFSLSAYQKQHLKCITNLSTNFRLFTLQSFESQNFKICKIRFRPIKKLFYQQDRHSWYYNFFRGAHKIIWKIKSSAKILKLSKWLIESITWRVKS